MKVLAPWTVDEHLELLRNAPAGPEAESAPDDCSHCGAPGDDIDACRMKCTIAGAQCFPCHGEAP